MPPSPPPSGDANPVGDVLRDLAGSARSRTTYEFVHQTVRRAILNGDLPGGTRLVQAELADQLSVSTTPVREALRDLAKEGLIHFDPHRGAIVRELELDEVREIYELRKVLEPMALRLAAERITDAELEEAAELQEQMRTETEPGGWVELNRRFHAVFAEAAGSPRLGSILAGLGDSAAVYVGLSIKVRPAHLMSGNEDHGALLEAVRRRDGDAAAEIGLRHLESTMHVIDAMNEDAVDADP